MIDQLTEQKDTLLAFEHRTGLTEPVNPSLNGVFTGISPGGMACTE